MTTLILGTSDKSGLYSCRAMTTLIKYGHRVVPIHPTFKAINKVRLYKSVGIVKELLHMLTVHVSLAMCDPLEAEMLKLML